MNVWVVKTSEMLAGDNESGRLLRSGLIAHMLDARGHTVTWWMSTFDHANRRNRFQHDMSVPFGARGLIRMLKSPGYKKSISLARFQDHLTWGRRFERAIETAPAPDIIFCAYPTIEAASIAVQFGRRQGVPVVVDLRDMWPDIFVENVPAPLMPIARAALWPLRSRARNALRDGTALFAITEEFLQWGLAFGHRPRGVWDCAFPLGYPQSDFEPLAKTNEAEVSEFWDRLGVTRESAFNVVLVGSMTRRRFEMDAVLTAARNLQYDARKVRFVIAGDGDELPKYRTRGQDCRNVLFPGWLRAPQIRELLSRAHLGLVPYRNTSDLLMSIPNKVGEYFASGVPVATCLRGTLPKLLREKRCGMEFSESHPTSLVDLVRKLRDDEPLRAQLAANARTTFRDQFVAETVYGRLIDQLEAIVGASRDASVRTSHERAYAIRSHARQ